MYYNDNSFKCIQLLTITLHIYTVTMFAGLKLDRNKILWVTTELCVHRTEHAAFAYTAVKTLGLVQDSTDSAKT